jgi:hypothetical protein
MALEGLKLSNQFAILVHVNNITGTITLSSEVHSCLCGHEIPYFYKIQMFIIALTKENHYYPYPEPFVSEYILILSPHLCPGPPKQWAFFPFRLSDQTNVCISMSPV